MAQHLSPALKKALKAAEAAIVADPRGELVLEHRRAIWAAMGEPEYDPDGFAEGLGHARRVELAQLVSRSILQYWTQALPGDTRATELLDKIDAYVQGEDSSGPMWDAIEALSPSLEELADPRAACVGYAAIHAAEVALRDEALEDPEPEPDAEPPDPDAPNPAGLDSAYFAVVACAGLEDEEQNVRERRRFWTWYVQEAVPEAFTTFGA